MGLSTSVFPNPPGFDAERFKVLSAVSFVDLVKNVNGVGLLATREVRPPFGIFPCFPVKSAKPKRVSGVSPEITAQNAPGISRDVMLDKICFRSYDVMGYFSGEDFHFRGYIHSPNVLPKEVGRGAAGFVVFFEFPIREGGLVS